MDKESLIAKALLAHSMERYHDLLQIMRQILALPLPLSDTERKLLHLAYSHICKTQFQSLMKLCHFYVRNVENLTTREVKILKSYFMEIRNDLVNNCNEITDISHYFIIPATMIEATKDNAVLYLCMKGNYHSIVATFTAEPHARNVSISKAQTAYERGYHMAQNSLAAVNSVRLRIAISYSTFICNMQQDIQSGCLLLKKELQNYELERQAGAEISATSASHVKVIRNKLSILRRTLMGMIFPEYEYDSSSSSDS